MDRQVHPSSSQLWASALHCISPSEAEADPRLRETGRCPVSWRPTDFPSLSSQCHDEGEWRQSGQLIINSQYIIPSLCVYWTVKYFKNIHLTENYFLSNKWHEDIHIIKTGSHSSQLVACDLWPLPWGEWEFPPLGLVSLGSDSSQRSTANRTIS